jgi:hypothetical protein
MVDIDHAPRYVDARKSQRLGADWWLVGDPALWRSVLEELAAEHAAAVARHEAFYEQARANGWGIARWMTQPLPGPPQAEAYEYRLREYICAHCSGGYLGCSWRQPRLYVCSDRCKREREKTLRRQWRAANPPDSQQKNAIRMKRRAAARAGRVCEHCGVPLEAARSRKRFCSDVCRVRHSRPSVALQ